MTQTPKDSDGAIKYLSDIIQAMDADNRVIKRDRDRLDAGLRQLADLCWRGDLILNMRHFREILRGLGYTPEGEE